VNYPFNKILTHRWKQSANDECRQWVMGNAVHNVIKKAGSYTKWRKGVKQKSHQILLERATHPNLQENSTSMLNNTEEKFTIVIIFHEMKHKDEKVTLFNNVLCAFIINQGFSLFGHCFGRKTALYSILNCSLMWRSVHQIHQPSFYLGWQSDWDGSWL